MKLTVKDAEFLQALRPLLESADLWVELKPAVPSYMVLRGTYGTKIHQTFQMTRQGVRWRFWRVLNEMYVASFTTILAIEKLFGSQLRDHAIRISKERYALQQEAMHCGFTSASQCKRAGAPRVPGVPGVPGEPREPGEPGEPGAGVPGGQ